MATPELPATSKAASGPRTSTRKRKKTGSGRLDIDKVYQAAQYAESKLPVMLERLFEAFMNGELKGKEMIMAVRAFQSATIANPRMEHDLGISKRSDGATGGQTPLIQLIADKITVQELKKLPQEEADMLVLEALKGDRKAVSQRLPELGLAS